MTPKQGDDALARSAIYELLSLAFLYPDSDTVGLLREGAAELVAQVGDREFPGVKDALDELIRELDSAPGQIEGEYEAVFGHTISNDCAPYEGEYGQAHVFQKSQTLADLSTFYGAWGVNVSPDLHDRVDHISVETEFMHLLTLKEAHALANGHGDDKVQLCRQAQEAFLANHLAGWVMDFGERLTKKAAGSGPYSSLARMLQAHMATEFRRFQLEAAPAGKAPSVEADEGDPEECGVMEEPDRQLQEVMTLWDR